jgi:hypothetical protein
MLTSRSVAAIGGHGEVRGLHTNSIPTTVSDLLQLSSVQHPAAAPNDGVNVPRTANQGASGLKQAL